MSIIEALFYMALGIVRGLITCPRTRIEIKPGPTPLPPNEALIQRLLPTEAEWREFEHEITREGGRA